MEGTDDDATIARLQQKVDDLQEMIDDAADAAAAADAKEKADAEAAAATTKAKMVLTALNAAVLDTADDIAEPSLSVAASSDGMLTVKSAGYEMTGAAGEIDGWQEIELTNGDDMLVVYSDIDDAEPKALSSLYTAAQGVYTVELSPAENSGDVPWGQTDSNDLGDNLNLATVGSGATAKTTFSGGVKHETSQGYVTGTFSCTGTSCTPPSPDESGNLTGGTGVWTFVPTNSSDTTDVQDKNYLQFGWWLGKTADGYVVDIFQSATDGGELTANTGTGQALEGSAKYMGGAAGKYAMVSTIENSAEGGHFTATAALTARFDADLDGDAETTEDAENGVMISGTISDFMTANGSKDDWKVALSIDGAIDDLADDNLSGGAATRTAKWTTGGGVAGTGSWSAAFYGSEDETQHPMAVTGEFNAQIGSGDIATIVGAFGAHKQ